MTKRRYLSLRGLGAALLLAACDTTGKDPRPPGVVPGDVSPGDVVPGDDAQEFVSHVAGRSVGGAENDASSESEGAGGASSAPRDDSAGNQDADRAIAEADILKRDGDTLYALSRYAGLSVIDISNPRRLVLLGRHRANAQPFEMYVQNGVAYIMYNNYGRYGFDAALDEWTYKSASHVTAVDVSDPGQISVIGEHEVPGSISDSRLVGDILYLATFESGYCWRCETKPNTRVASFDISDPAHFEKIDEVRFPDEGRGYGQRSIAVTSQRIYVGGPNWENRDSNIRIVDISDPAGDLVLGADIPLHGAVESRWQMDEYEGVLRVISQPTAWRTNDPPHVQTFRVESSQKVSALASLPVKLPRPEDLRSVRFDGTRAYAVTFQQTDPLFTFDLSDPAQPKQLGELEIPGFLYHMEPRGDRMLALGYDFARDGGGALHVSIFDVADLRAPTMLARVNFGGSWANLAEDQDRIHKAFGILPELGLITVPFGGGSYDEGTCHYAYQSGVQLIDFDQDTLTLRGVVPQVGEARRAFVHRDHLFGITDNAVSVFDIRDRDAPRARAELEVARNISQVHVLGDTLLRFGNDWWTKRSLVDFTSLDASSDAEPLGELDLASLLDDEPSTCGGSSNWDSQLYVHGEVAYAPRRSRSWRDNTSEETLTLYVIDLHDRTAPKLAGKISASSTRSNRDGYSYLGGIVMTDHALLIGRGEGSYSYDPISGSRSETKYSYDVYDLADPLAPKFTTRFQVPGHISSGGWGWGFEGCGMDMPWGYWYGGSSSGALVSGDLVVSQHEQELDDGTGRVRYFLDRLDVSDPAKPKLLPEINIPGQVVHFDGPGKRLVTLEYTYEQFKAESWEDCRTHGSRAYLSEKDVCRVYNRRANALVLEGNHARRVSMVALDDDQQQSGSIAVTDERLFVIMEPTREPDALRAGAQRLESFAFSPQGELIRLAPVALEGQGLYWGQLYARAARAFLSQEGFLSVVDTGEGKEPALTKHELQGWGCDTLEVHGDRAFCALGQYGVLSLDL